ncbi:MAG: CoA ester lyase [Chloroflexi bacterium]|nr:CoA ester lyase [Chloroflexota bacterium]
MYEQQCTIPILRSILFVPTIVERFVARAPETGADVVCLDVEDSVPPAEKAKARAAAAEAIDGMPRSGFATFVRVNGLHTGLLEDDLLAVVRPGLDGIVLSKAHTAETVRRADHYLTILERQQGMETGTVSIIPLVESAEGILNSREISAASPRLVGLSLGAEDLAVDMGLQRSEEAREIEWPRAQLATAAAAADLAAIDTPEPDYTDMEHLERDSSYARSLGFRGKYCIHPGQVEVVNRVFSPTEQEIAEAKDVVRLLDKEGIAKGIAAIPVNGKMIDTPIYWQAKRLLRWAEAAGISTQE